MTVLENMSCPISWWRVSVRNGTSVIRRNLRCHTQYQTKSNSSSARFKFKESSRGGKKGPSPGDYALLVFPCTAFGLGVWQTQRKSWKLDLISELDLKTTADPCELPTSLVDVGAQLEYRPVQVTGVFDHTREHYIGPRSLLTDGEEQASRGLSSNPEGIGWHVITPLLISRGEHKGAQILVNRGWVPQAKLRPETRLEGQVKGEVDLTGIVRKNEPRAQFTPKNRIDSDQWQHRDLPALADKLGTLPVFIDAKAETSVPGGPIGGQTKISLRNEHLSYMITWFSLSGITAYMWYARFLKR